MSAAYVLAQPVALRASFHEARRAFGAGAEVLVTEEPRGDEVFVYPSTTTHTCDSVSWAELTDQVRMWRSRYPRQTFYVVQP